MMEEVNEFDFENRIVTNEYDALQDSEVENSLRPKTLDEYVGQTKAKENLKIYCRGGCPYPPVKTMWLSNKSIRRPHLPIHHKQSQGRRWGAMGAPPVAESSDLSEWPRSVSDAAAPSARRAPGTATGAR